VISKINLDQSFDKLFESLIDLKVEVGSIRFNNTFESIQLDSRYKKIGNMELDIIALNLNNNEIVLLDHDQPDFVMAKIAKNLNSLICALEVVEQFFLASLKDEDLFYDEDRMMKVAQSASRISEGDVNFYIAMFGI
jgi:flagellar biosynthesis/type III secretory pathway chaperone